MRLLRACLFVSTVALIQGAPHTVQKRVGNLPIIPGDEDVSSLSALKSNHEQKWNKLEKRMPLLPARESNHLGMRPTARETSQHGMMPQMPARETSHQGMMPQMPDRETSHQFSRSSQSAYSNVHGNKHQFNDQKERIVHNGELMGLLHKTKLGEALEGQKPHENDLTEISIPRLGINNKIINHDGVQTSVKTKRNGGQRVHVPEGFASKAQYTPNDLAQYILDTGDQAGVVQLLQNLIQTRKISEEEALMYVDSIKGQMEKEEKAVMEEEQELEEEQEEGQETNKMVMRINDYLDRQMEEGKISEKLYSNLKDTLMESLIRDLRMQLDQPNEVDYPGY